MEDMLPRASGVYLTTILGSINVSILDKKAKYDYKDQYERFKMVVNLVGKMIHSYSYTPLNNIWITEFFQSQVAVLGVTMYYADS